MPFVTAPMRTFTNLGGEVDQRSIDRKVRYHEIQPKDAYVSMGLSYLSPLTGEDDEDKFGFCFVVSASGVDGSQWDYDIEFPGALDQSFWDSVGITLRQFISITNDATDFDAVIDAILMAALVQTVLSLEDGRLRVDLDFGRVRMSGVGNILKPDNPWFFL